MAVYTQVQPQDVRGLLLRLKLGDLQTLQGCHSGIENTNYFVTVQDGDQSRDYVLTLFERLTPAQLPFYLHLMKHLAQRGILVPDPCPDADGSLVLTLCGKPAAVVNRLPGCNAMSPTPVHCAQVAAMLAKMHLAGQSFELHQPHLRGLDWWNQTVPVLLPYLNASQTDLILQELASQNHLATTADYAALPRGPIHADLFRDNVMFDTVDGQPVLGGFFDFYFAGVDAWLFDLAVCLNDWCIDPLSGLHHAPRAAAFMAAYNAVRPLADAERALLPAMLRAAALRFWVSRLWDFYLPRQACLLQPHDPAHFERVLRHRADTSASHDLLAGCRQ